MFTQLYVMELYSGGIHLIVKKYLKFRKENSNNFEFK